MAPKKRTMREFDSKWTDVYIAIDAAIEATKARSFVLASSYIEKAAVAAERYCHNKRGARAFGNTVAWMLRDIEYRNPSTRSQANKLEVIQVFIDRELALAVRNSEIRNGVSITQRKVKHSQYVRNAQKMFEAITKFIEETS